jgi:DNA primase
MSAEGEEIAEQLDLEYWFDREGLAHKMTRGGSGQQIQVQECPSCGDRKWKVYLNAETGLGNCLAGETMILTREYGAVPIERVVGKTVTLLDGNGNWVPCVIYDHGIQETVALRFADGFNSFVIRSTEGHGWITDSGNIVLTSELRKLKFVNQSSIWKIADLRPTREVIDPAEYERGVIHGLIYGDGSKENAGTFRIRICSHHKDLIPWLDRYSQTPVGGDPRFYIPRREAWCEFKEFPKDPNSSIDYLLGFFRGWFAADGCVSKEPAASLCCGPEELEWIKVWSPLVGWQIRGASVLAARTNLGARRKASMNVHFKRTSMEAADFLIERHRSRWIAAEANRMKRVWRVRGGVGETRMERVYCPFVPTTNSFALANGLHSRNCFKCDTGFNKLKFINLALGLSWAETFKHCHEVMKEQGWKPKRVTSMAVEHETAKFPDSYELPTPAGQNLVYLEARGITGETAKYFHLRMCESGWWNFKKEDGSRGGQKFDGRLIIPIYDLDGTFVTFQGRDVTGTDLERKYLFPKLLPGTGSFLLNGQNALRAKRVLMVEGFFDVAAAKLALDEEVALRDVVPIGTFGKHLSYGALDGDDQLGRLLRLKAQGLEEVTLMYDGERPALNSALNAAKLIKRAGLQARVALLPFKKDPNEVMGAIVREAFWKAQPYTLKLDATWRLRSPYPAR